MLILEAQGLLKRFSATNQRPPPSSILFYRDGVSGELEMERGFQTFS